MSIVAATFGWHVLADGGLDLGSWVYLVIILISVLGGLLGKKKKPGEEPGGETPQTPPTAPPTQAAPQPTPPRPAPPLVVLQPPTVRLPGTPTARPPVRGRPGPYAPPRPIGRGPVLQQPTGPRPEPVSRPVRPPVVAAPARPAGTYTPESIRREQAARGGVAPVVVEVVESGPPGRRMGPAGADEPWGKRSPRGLSGALRGALQDRDELQRALVLSEILAPPLALRRDPWGES